MKCIGRIVALFGIIFWNEADGAVLLWSRNYIEIAPLNVFSDSELAKLVNDLGSPDVYVFKTDTLRQEFKDIFDGFQSAYNANGYINNENVTVLTNEIKDFLKLKDAIQNLGQNVLVVMVITDRRYKREAVTSETPAGEPPKGPVLYKVKSKTGDNYGLLYSSKPLLLKVNNSSFPVYHLGNAPTDMITMDTAGRDSYTRLNINIPMVNNSKITLRFYFTWTPTYWSLQEVRFSDITHNIAFNLTINKEFFAPAHFSYHCGDVTSFSDITNGVDMYLYDMQVQIDSHNGRFGDAYDCVPFTTVPIWSGLFITTLLAIGLTVSLLAIEGIKTMDRFDNQKTKQLAITIFE